MPGQCTQIFLDSTRPHYRQETFDALVLDSVLRQSLVTVRSLGKRHLHVAALEVDGYTAVPTFASRWCQRRIINPASEGTDAYLANLLQILDQKKVYVLISSSDGTIALLRKYRALLEHYTHIALAKEAALDIAVNKTQTLAVARQLGIGVPRSIRVNTMEDVPTAIQEIGLPVVIKPDESWIQDEQKGASRFGATLATTLAEAQQAVAGPISLGGSVLFQQFLSGRREAVNLFYANRTLYARFAQWAKRTEPQLGGTSVMRQSIAVPDDIGTQAEHLIREIDLEGYSEVEFRRDAAGTPYLMEINPRLSASVEVAVRSGVDFPYLLYQWAVGGPIDHVADYRKGYWMRYLKGDFFTTLEAIQHQSRPGVASAQSAIRDFFTSFVVPSGYDYADWTDPKPAIVATADFFQHRVGPAISKRLFHTVR